MRIRDDPAHQLWAAETRRKEYLKKVIFSYKYYRSKFYKTSVYARLILFLFTILIFVFDDFSYFSENDIILKAENVKVLALSNTLRNGNSNTYIYYSKIYTQNQNSFVIQLKDDEKQYYASNKIIIKRDIFFKKVKIETSDKPSKIYFIESVELLKYCIAFVALFSIFLFLYKENYVYLMYNLYFFYFTSFTLLVAYFFNFSFMYLIKYSTILIIILPAILKFLDYLTTKFELKNKIKL